MKKAERIFALTLLTHYSVSGICGIAFFVFLVLKLLGKITWLWWWVTAPLLLSFSTIIASCIVFSKVRKG